MQIVGRCPKNLLGPKKIPVLPVAAGEKEGREEFFKF